MLQDELAYLMYAPRLELKDKGNCLNVNAKELLEGSDALHSARRTSFWISILVFGSLLVFLVPVIMIFRDESRKSGLLLFKGAVACSVLMAILFVAGASTMRGYHTELQKHSEQYIAFSESDCFVESRIGSLVGGFSESSGSIGTLATLWTATTVIHWLFMIASAVVLIVAKRRGSFDEFENIV